MVAFSNPEYANFGANNGEFDRFGFESLVWRWFIGLSTEIISFSSLILMHICINMYISIYMYISIKKY
jgi:hypothetical protein